MTGLVIEMLPACEGDCLWISYGPDASRRHVLVDGGRKSTAEAIRSKIEALPAGRRRLELVVVTHVDRDHIEGMLELVDAGFYGAAVGDFWFNGYEHLDNGYVSMGPLQGERLSRGLIEKGISWNSSFKGGRIAVDDDNPLPRIPLAGGLDIVLLSPTPAKLMQMRPVWEEAVRKAGIVDAVAAKSEALPDRFERMGGLDIDKLAALPFTADRAQANGTSIAMLFEYRKRRVLLGADAHPEVLLASLARFGAGAAVQLNAFKIPHHCSAHNISRELLQAIACSRYLVSTNGSYFGHPDESAIARIIGFGGKGPELIFNYRSHETGLWDDDALRSQHGYSTRYPPHAEGYQRVEI